MSHEEGSDADSRTTPFGSLLTHYRICAGLTVADLAHESNMSVRLIEYLISGERRVNKEVLDNLVTALSLGDHDRRVLLTALTYSRSVPSTASATHHNVTSPARSFAELFTHYRLLLGKKRGELAETLGVSPRYIRQLEADERSPKLSSLRDWCVKLGLPEQDRVVLYSAAANLAAPETMPGQPSPPVTDPAVPSLIGLADTKVHESEFESIKLRLISGPWPRYVALLGLPGIGKTTIAMRLAQDQSIREHFTDGVLWAQLGDAPQVTSHYRRWATLLGVLSSTMDKSSHQVNGSRFYLTP